MGKGDKRTKRGKIHIGTSGNTRLSKKNKRRKLKAKKAALKS
jgi:ribosomal small subunit protein bTHX